jgi:hypothetical protein
MTLDDEEAQPTKANAHAASIERHDDDEDDCSIDGMEVEDWLIKQHAKTPDGLHQAHKRPEATATDECLIDDILAYGRKQSKGISPQEQKTTSTAADEEEGTIVELPPPAGSLTRTEALDPTVILDAEAKTLSSCENFVVAEVSLHNNQLLVIEGVKTMDPRHKRIYLLLGTLVVSALIAVSAGTVSKRFLSSRSAVGGGEMTLASNTTATAMPPAPTILSGGGNLSLTIGEAWGTIAQSGLESFASQNGALAFFQKWISRTDKNFTFFSASKKANTLGGIGLSLIQKTLSPGWNGHVVSRFKVIFQTHTPFLQSITISLA